jgi:hypothetical protein
VFPLRTRPVWVGSSECLIHFFIAAAPYVICCLTKGKHFHYIFASYIYISLFCHMPSHRLSFHSLTVTWGYPTSTYTLAQLGVLLHMKTICYRPRSWQQRCYAKSDALFLDCLMRAGFMLPLTFEVTVQDGIEVWTCVHGQKRLRTLILFFDGVVPCSFPSCWFLCPS